MTSLRSLHSEAAALLSILAKVGEHIQLIIFTDCLVILLILSKWGHIKFLTQVTWPSRQFFFDPKTSRTVKEVILIKVKSHAGCLMADECAETGYLSDADPICCGPKKYGSL